MFHAERMMKRHFFLLAAMLLASSAWAEPTFLAKQYTRCTACHYSPSGGGLLTPYGRLLSHRELSTWGRNATDPNTGAEEESHGEQAFLYGALGDALGPVRLGLDMRPSHLRVGFPGGHQHLNLQMTLDLIGAVQKNGWIAYGSAGREPANSATRNGRTLSDPAFISYEHWISYQVDDGFRIRAGRFLPAYGVRVADHTTYSRRYLDLDRNDQVYGLEVSDTIGPSLIQVMVSPGKAEAILHDRDHRGFSSAARWQFDLAPRATIVGSALYRHSTRADPRSGAAGAAVGFAPTSRVSIWTEVNANLQTMAAGGRSWLVVNETSIEVYRGIWLKFSPQLRTSGEVPGSSRKRLAFAANLFPRTHWNVNLGYYYDRALTSHTSTLLAQLHLFM
jgi:hypothetical protein